MRAAAVVIQKNFRAYNGRKKYQQMRTGEAPKKLNFPKQRSYLHFASLLPNLKLFSCLMLEQPFINYTDFY